MLDNASYGRLSGRTMTPPDTTPIDAVQVRRATLGDVSEGIELMRRLAVFEGHGAAFTATPERLAEGLFGPVPGLLCWVAESDGRILGVALCATTWVGITCRPSLRLLNLVVDEAVRGRGVGAQLMTAVAATCIELDCSLDWMVRTDNLTAQGFYLSRPQRASAVAATIDELRHRLAGTRETHRQTATPAAATTAFALTLSAPSAMTSAVFPTNGMPTVSSNAGDPSATWYPPRPVMRSRTTTEWPISRCPAASAPM